MPTEKAIEKKYQRDQEYLRENTTKLTVVFNRKKPADLELLQWVKSRPEGVTKYIKALAMEDMKKSAE